LILHSFYYAAGLWLGSRLNHSRCSRDRTHSAGFACAQVTASAVPPLLRQRGDRIGEAVAVEGAAQEAGGLRALLRPYSLFGGENSLFGAKNSLFESAGILCRTLWFSLFLAGRNGPATANLKKSLLFPC
jgi:hypothetical protein